MTGLGAPCTLGPPNSDTSGPLTKHTVFGKITKLFLVIPVSSATAERSFLAMRRLKTYLRSIMSTERLNSVITLHVHKDLLDCIDDSAVVKNFVACNEVRKDILERAKFAGSVGHPMTKMLSASGGLCPPDHGLCSWAPLGALPPDSRYRLVLCTRYGAPRPLTPSADYAGGQHRTGAHAVHSPCHNSYIR